MGNPSDDSAVGGSVEPSAGIPEAASESTRWEGLDRLVPIAVCALLVVAAVVWLRRNRLQDEKTVEGLREFDKIVRKLLGRSGSGFWRAALLGPLDTLLG